MLVRSTENGTLLKTIPWILSLNKSGEALGWITFQDCAYYKARNKILWSMGEYEIVLRGGINAITGKQSKLIVETIVALNSDKSPSKFRKVGPSLTNKTLFARDRHLCAYCGETFLANLLTRDHVVPTSKGGRDIWQNVVTACKSCNSRKGDKSPEQSGMTLLYVPYMPNFNEHLILQNRKILQDQQEFLMAGISRNSRLRMKS